MKVIIAGGRDFDNYPLMERKLDLLFSLVTPDEIVSGAAKGADALGERYTKEHNIPLKLFKADWEQYKKAAGHIRNAEMAEYADTLVAFFDGSSRGTKNMLDVAAKKGLNIRTVSY